MAAMGLFYNYLCGASVLLLRFERSFFNFTKILT